MQQSCLQTLCMKKILFLCLMIFCIGNSCEKSSSGGTAPPPDDPNKEVKAMISIKGGTVYSLTATGRNTSCSKITYTNGDVSIRVTGSDSKGSINLGVVNITLPGTYTIGTSPVLAGDKSVYGSFEIGNALLDPDYEIFLVKPPPPPSGTMTIYELTANSIRGSFSMTCVGRTGTVEITNGTFKEIF